MADLCAGNIFALRDSLGENMHLKYLNFSRICYKCVITTLINSLQHITMAMPKSAHDKKESCKIAIGTLLCGRMSMRRMSIDAKPLYMSKGRFTLLLC